MLSFGDYRRGVLRVEDCSVRNNDSAGQTARGGSSVLSHCLQAPGEETGGWGCTSVGGGGVGVFFLTFPARKRRCPFYFVFRDPRKQGNPLAPSRKKEREMGGGEGGCGREGVNEGEQEHNWCQETSVVYQCVRTGVRCRLNSVSPQICCRLCGLIVPYFLLSAAFAVSDLSAACRVRQCVRLFVCRTHQTVLGLI